MSGLSRRLSECVTCKLFSTLEGLQGYRYDKFHINQILIIIFATQHNTTVGNEDNRILKEHDIDMRTKRATKPTRWTSELFVWGKCLFHSNKIVKYGNWRMTFIRFICRRQYKENECNRTRKPHHKNEFSEWYVHRCMCVRSVSVDGPMRLAIGLKIFPVVSGDGLMSCSQKM